MAVDRAIDAPVEALSVNRPSPFTTTRTTPIRMTSRHFLYTVLRTGCQRLHHIPTKRYSVVSYCNCPRPTTVTPPVNISTNTIRQGTLLPLLHSHSSVFAAFFRYSEAAYERIYVAVAQYQPIYQSIWSQMAPDKLEQSEEYLRNLLFVRHLQPSSSH